MSDTIPSLVNNLKFNKIDLLSYLDQRLEHIEAQDKIICALLPEDNRRKRLLQDAKQLMQKHPDPAGRPPLFGLPIGVKDIFCVGGFPTRCGSKLPIELFDGPEAPSVSKLKNAGALILGKMVTTEFACFSPGPTRNPHQTVHTPGGSSSGSAAAVSADFCHFAFGTQTIGSIIRPAAYCGVVGFKPTYNRISKEGVIPVSCSVDTVGGFTKSVSDMNYVASVLFTDWINHPIQKQPVLGIPEGPYLKHVDRIGQTCFDEVCESLKQHDFEIKTISCMADFAEIEIRHKMLMAYEAAIVHKTWYETHHDLYTEQMQSLIDTGRSVTIKMMSTGLDGIIKLRRELSYLMAQHGVDLWISPPAQGPPPEGLDSTGDPIMNLPWTHAGLPTVTIPCGTKSGCLPMGIQLTAGWNEDEKLLAYSTQIEAILKTAPILL